MKPAATRHMLSTVCTMCAVLPHYCTYASSKAERLNLNEQARPKKSIYVVSCIKTPFIRYIQFLSSYIIAVLLDVYFNKMYQLCVYIFLIVWYSAIIISNGQYEVISFDVHSKTYKWLLSMDSSFFFFFKINVV